MKFSLSYTDYHPFGMVIEGRSASSGDQYRYGFNGQEKDDELKGSVNSYAYEYRFHDPRLGRFLSIDPLATRYAYNSPYGFCENRVIDGSELEGLEWKSEKNWSDQASDADLQKAYGNSKVSKSIQFMDQTITVEVEAWTLHRGETYEALWTSQVPFYLKKHEGEVIDCADYSIYVLVEFAGNYKLPLTFSDHTIEGRQTFDNDNFSYKDENGNTIPIAEGDWKTLAKQIGNSYGAAHLYSTYSMMTQTLYNPYPHDKDPPEINNTGNIMLGRPGDMVGYKYGESGPFHNQTIYSTKLSKTNSGQIMISFTSYSGNENNGMPTAVTLCIYTVLPPYNQVSDKDGNPVKYNPQPKLIRWDFGYFDRNR